MATVAAGAACDRPSVGRPDGGGGTLRGMLGAIPPTNVPFFTFFSWRSGQGHGQSPGRARERP
eukprot:395435-Prymnesium_polylepis.1